MVALRKESVDRNTDRINLSDIPPNVALRKESVDRNKNHIFFCHSLNLSLSARRAWIEITTYFDTSSMDDCRSPQGERG